MTNEAKTVEEILLQLAGSASMCWKPRPSNEVFNPEEANKFVKDSLSQLKELVVSVDEIKNIIHKSDHPWYKDCFDCRNAEFHAKSIHNLFIENLFGKEASNALKSKPISN